MASPRILPASPLQRLTTFKESNPNSSAVGALATPAPSPLETFASDPIFSAFLSHDFDCARFSSQALSSGSAAARAENLQEAICLLQKHLRSEVLDRHPALLSQLSSLNEAEASLSSVRSTVSSLQSSLLRSRQELADPLRLVRSHTIQLSNLHSAADLLSSSARLLRVSKKLRDVMSQPADRLDLAKAAEMHRDIELLYQERGLAGISVVEDEIRWLSETGNRLRSQAMKAVERGMDEHNQNDIWCGLQVFYNLGELRSTVDQLVNKYKASGVKCVGAALDVKAISAGTGGVQRSGAPPIGAGKRAGEPLWERMGRCMDDLHKLMTAVWQLQSVLSKKRVPFTQVLFLHEVWQEGEPLLTDRVWTALVKYFASQMKSAFNTSSFVKEVFTVGYPKLFTMIENLLERISRDTDVKGVLSALTLEGKDEMIAALNIFQTSFLALCLGRLTDYVNSIFSVSGRGTVPSKDQISRLILRIQEEIEAVKLHRRLMLLVLHEIGKVLLLVAEKAEYQISAGPESRQVTGSANPAQLKNMTLCQQLEEIHARVSASLPPDASEILSPSLGAIHGVACESTAPLFQSMLDRLESCVLGIHGQDFSSSDNSASPYMEELQRCAAHLRAEFLPTVAPPLVRRMAARVVAFFLRHAALVRPLSEEGRLRLARDMAELELAVGQNLFPVEQLGAAYRALRAFRPMIFLETEKLQEWPLLWDLPAADVLHHLYSRGPDRLLSPMQRNGLTPVQYSLWLDSQGQHQDQLWKEIKATLDHYQATVGDLTGPVFSLMLHIGSAISSSSSSSSS